MQLGKNIWLMFVGCRRISSNFPLTIRYDDPVHAELFAEHIAGYTWFPEERDNLFADLKRVGKILQGPFYLGDGIVVGGFWDKRAVVAPNPWQDVSRPD